MKEPTPDPRESRILDAASDLMVRFGYDKTTVSEIAAEAGVSKGAIYLHFQSKEELFEALLVREMKRHGEVWLQQVEADPLGGTMGGLYKNVLLAMHASPLMSAIFQQDSKILGTYLRQPGNLFETMQAQSMRAEFVEAMQQAGVVRPDVKPEVAAHVMDLIGYGMVGLGDIKAASAFPQFEDVINFIAEMMDRMLAPEQGADSEAGKAVVRRITEASYQYLDEQVAKKGEEKK